VLPAGYAIRPRRPGDDDALVRIENAANRLLAGHGYPELAEHGIPDVAYLAGVIGDGDVFVAATADDAPVGYAIAQAVGRRLHLRELSVDPAHGRRGLGSALVRRVVERARAGGFTGVSLTTFRDVPFNAPFYAGLGFVLVPFEVAEARLCETLHRELPDGVDPADRVIMTLDF
jgi:GNAT superfamily N-acetyltransferase